MSKRRWIVVWIVLVLLLTLPDGVNAAEPVFFFDSSVEVHFGSSVDFSVQLQSLQSVEKLWLFLEPQGSELTLLEIPLTTFDEEVSFQLNPNALPLRVFGDVVYWYQADFTDGSSLTSEDYSFTYLDDRFSWRALQTDHFRLYWYDGDLNFGTAAINTAEESFGLLSQEFGDVFGNSVIDVFLYGSRSALQDTLSASAYAWVAGHADPELGQMLLSISPGVDQKTEMERQIPHELAHLFTFQVAGSSYTRQPAWLLEGLATQAEIYSSSTYPQLLVEAVSENRLIPLQLLCVAFPTDGDDVYLAYAEAGSFVEYLRENHGSDALHALLQEYGSGTNCEPGFVNTFGVTLGQMEKRWQMQVLGVNPLLSLIQQMAPYLVLVAMMLMLPLLLSLLQRKETEKNEQG